MQPRFIRDRFLHKVTWEDLTPAQADALIGEEKGAPRSWAYSDRCSQEATIPPWIEDHSEFEHKYVFRDQINVTLPRHFESPVEKDEIIYRMEYVPTVDNFTDEEHKLFLACLIPVEGARRCRKFNHTGWLLSNKTHTDMLNHFYMWKYEGVQSHPSHKEWEAVEECKEKRHAKVAKRPAKKTPKQTFTAARVENQSQDVLPGPSTVAKSRLKRRRTADSSSFMTEESLSDEEYAPGTGTKTRKSQKGSPRTSALKRSKTEPTPVATSMSQPKKRKHSEMDQEDTGTASPTKRRGPNDSEPKNFDEALLKTRKSQYSEARKDGKPNSDFRKEFTDVETPPLIPYDERPAETAATNSELMKINREAFELIQICLLLTWYILQLQRRRVEPGKTRNWGASQWQLCAVGDAKKIRAVGEAMEAAGMFKSEWCLELYARADADLEKLADWERDHVPTGGKWPRSTKGCRGYIVRRRTPVTLPATTCATVAYLTPTKSGGSSQEPSPPTPWLELEGPNISHPPTRLRHRLMKTTSRTHSRPNHTLIRIWAP
jgi:hypothetical protein